MPAARKEEKKFPVHYCMAPLCGVYASFGFHFGKAWYCGEHKLLGMTAPPPAPHEITAAQGKLL